MLDTSPQWHSILYTLIPHPAQPRILLRPETAGWSLPRVRLEKRVWPANAVAVLHEALRRELGLEATVLRCAQTGEDEAAHRVDAIYTLENHSPAWTSPHDWQWIDRAALADLPLAQPQYRAVLEACLAELEGAPVPELRPPWARPGWYKQATAWMETELARLGYTRLGAIEMVKTWGISAILRAGTTDGNVYFKQAAKLSLFADEPVLTKALAALYPDHVPVPLAIDAERGWMLLPDVGTPMGRAESMDPTVEEATISLLGKLQRRSVAHLDTLFASGCLDRRLDVLAAQIDPLLRDAAAFPGFEAEEIAELRALAPRLKALCGKLASYGIPPALVHGDLHWGNIATQNGRTTIFDWTDCCIAHPFFDLVGLLGIAEESEDGPARHMHLRDSYLLHWTDYAPLEQLREAADLAAVLGALHQAVSYQHIVAGLEATSKHELASGFPDWSRSVLHALKRIDP